MYLKLLAITVLSIVIGSAHAQNQSDARFEKTISVLTSKKVFTSSYRSLLQQLQGICKPNPPPENDPYRKGGNVERVPDLPIKDLLITGSHSPVIGRIEAEITDRARCLHFRTIRTKQYGNPKQAKHNAI